VSVVEFEIRSRRDIVYAGDQDAALESNVFARENLVGPGTSAVRRRLSPTPTATTR
jgi:hypothetical protein